MTAEERSKHRAPNGDRIEKQKQTIFDAMTPEENNGDYEKSSPSNSHPNIKSSTSSEEDHFFSMNNWVPAFMKKHPQHKKRSQDSDRRSSLVSESSVGNSDIENSVDLELHMSLSCGNVTNIILGDIDPTESSIPLHLNTYPQVRNSMASSIGKATELDEFFLGYHGRLEYAIGGDVVDSLDEALSLAKAGEMSITPDAYEIVQSQAMNLTFEKRRGYFVIKNITEDQPIRKNNYPHTSPLRHNSSLASRKASAIVNNNADYLKTLPGLRTQATKMSLEPLIPRVRNTSYLYLPVELNRYYFKYISRSALYRLKNSVDGNLPAQFREVTIMFVSLGKPNVAERDELSKVQKAVLIAIRALVKYEGMLQQFAIDDKGKDVL